MALDANTASEEQQIYLGIAADASPELFCDACGFYPIEPVHGNFVCPSCASRLETPTKCCEGAPLNV